MTDRSTPGLPARIGRLGELAANLYWSWHPGARELFRMLDPSRWKRVRENPVELLREVTSEIDRRTILRAAADPAFRLQYDAVIKAFDAYSTGRGTWYASRYPALAELPIAYFSFEFGLHSSLPTYAGGLGVLAGDHCKESSDLGLPLVGVGFMYWRGYFRQRLSPDGWQEALSEYFESAGVPLQRVPGPGGAEWLVRVPLKARHVHVAAWKVQAGRVPLFLMDTNLEDNAPDDRHLTAQLYVGSLVHRFEQEIVFGVGGVRLLRALGIRPAVWHINEGHGAFVMLERARELVQQGLSLEDALEAVRASTVFTTHTPVPAGHDRFPPELVQEHLSQYVDEPASSFWEALGLAPEELQALGAHEEPEGVRFNMTVLGLRLAGRRNGVSQLHGAVTRRMWRALWPEASEEAVPIAAITNGVHVPTWLAPEMRDLFARHLGPDWVTRHDEPALWERIEEIPDQELWGVRVQLKRQLLTLIRDRARERWGGGAAAPEQILASGALLDPHALTIGFARRFATYKRADLLRQDLARLERILRDPLRPVQIILAGKAHPADEPGQRMIQRAFAVAKDRWFGGHVAFIEDYDMDLARHLVQGVDVWLNTPIRTHEASGTSGQKAALNGVPQISVLDGWWAEGYQGDNGWAIGSREWVDTSAEDEMDALALYRLLEDDVKRLYYERDRDGVPRGWLRVARNVIRSCAPVFSARRMVKEYADRMYAPAALAALPIARPGS